MAFRSAQFVFIGFDDKELVKKMKAEKAEVLKQVYGGVTLVVYKPPTTKKAIKMLEQAHELDLECMELDQFMAKFSSVFSA